MKNEQSARQKTARSQSILLSITLFLLFSITACSRLNCTRFEDVLGRPTNLIDFSYAIADNLIDRAMPPLIPQHPDMPIVVTTFVDNNDLTKTSQFGRVLQEHIVSRLVLRGYTVRELKTASTLDINPKKGETILTRDLAKLKNSLDTQALLVGTISRSKRILYISARLLDPTTSNILATDDYRLCMDDNILAMFGLQRSDEQDTSISEPRHPFF